MGAVTRVTRSCDVRHAAKLLGWTGLRAGPAGVAVAAVHGCHVAQIDRMLERCAFRGYKRGIPFTLTQHGVASIAFFGNDLALGADMLAVMAAKTSRKIEMTDVVVVSSPVQFHLWKGGRTVDPLEFRDRSAHVDLLRRFQGGVLARIKLMDFRSDALHGFVSTLVRIG